MFLIARQNLSDKILFRHKPIRTVSADQRGVG
jgi:hypothetical protein